MIQDWNENKCLEDTKWNEKVAMSIVKEQGKLFYAMGLKDQATQGPVKYAKV